MQEQNNGCGRPHRPLPNVNFVGVIGPTGPTGPAGPEGDPPSLTIGTVTTGKPGTKAAASITGTAPNFILNLTIPLASTNDSTESDTQI